ncbi:glycosyltransferase family 2 protein [Rufibacter roseolus]|uniref:glycosyltransferase family 2 protein n=1 Tax=Rufibacter roseolus TaxID=2817375 RepID=UPI001B30CF0C|nr:glycosyltransferase family 2 protein [Rufibacter roseolus]
MPLLSVIIPCYFNEQNIPVTVKELISNEVNFPSDVAFEYIFVDDGSKDNTFQELLKVKAQYPNKVKVIKLAGNVGSYNAVIAGMEYATGDCAVITSADLQDPLELMVKMYAYWQQGFKLVIGSRKDRDDPLVGKVLSNLFHSIMKKVALKNIPEGGFDYVLFDKLVKEEVLRVKENNSNVMYLMVWMGFDFVHIPYHRNQRKIGTSRWTLKKKIKLFIDSVLSFSYFPIRVISIVGLILGIAAFFYGIFVIIAKLNGGIMVEGWSALMVVVLFVSSFQMIALGIIGEYVWRALDASRKRPLYIVETVL